MLSSSRYTSGNWGYSNKIQIKVSMNEICHSITYKEEKLKMNAEKVCCLYATECQVAFKKRGRFVCIDIAWMDIQNIFLSKFNSIFCKIENKIIMCVVVCMCVLNENSDKSRKISGKGGGEENREIEFLFLGLILYLFYMLLDCCRFFLNSIYFFNEDVMISHLIKAQIQTESFKTQY